MEGDPNYRLLTAEEFEDLVKDVRLDPTTIKEGYEYYFIQKSTSHIDDFLEKYGSKPVRPNNIYANIIKAKIRRIDDGVTPSPFGAPYPKGMAVFITETNNDTPNYGRKSKRHREHRVSGLVVTTGMRINDNSDWVAIKDVEITDSGTKIGDKLVKKPKLGAADSYVETASEPTDSNVELSIKRQKTQNKEKEKKTVKGIFEVTEEVVVKNDKDESITIPVDSKIYSIGGFNSETCYNKEHKDDEEEIADFSAPYNNVGSGCFYDLEYRTTNAAGAPVIHKIPHVTSAIVESHMKQIQVASGRTRRKRRSSRVRKTRRRRIFICDV